jgi:hypothetical protein
MIIWPAELPQAMRADSFSAAAPDARKTAPMEYGPDKFGIRSTLAVQPIGGVIRCDQNQLARVLRFWHEDTSRGTKPFAFPDQAFNNAFLLDDAGEQLEDESGNILLVSAWQIVQFTGGQPPAYTPAQRSVVWNVQLNLKAIGG